MRVIAPRRLQRHRRALNASTKIARDVPPKKVRTAKASESLEYFDEATVEAMFLMAATAKASESLEYFDL